VNRWTPRVEEVLLATTTLVAVASFGRLFEDRAVVLPLLVSTVVAHVVMAVARRLDFGAAATWTAAAVGFVAATSILLYPHTSRFGLPGPTSLETARADLSAAWHLFSDVTAPAPRSRGFLLASSATIWLAVGLADWAGLRLRTTAEAVLPAVAVFCFTAILGEGPDGVALAVALAAAIGAFGVAQRARRSATDDTWVADGTRAGSRSVLARGLVGVVAASLLAGALVPRLPVTAQEAVLDWRGGGGPGDRVTVSPLVEIRGRLVEQSDRTVFTVVADRPAYWRLTSLDRFDGETWGSDDSFTAADGELPGRPPDATSTPLEQTFHIRSLGSLWAPAAATPVELLDTSEDLRWNGRLSTLIVNADASSIDDATYTVVSQIPDLHPADLNAPLPRELPADVAAATDLPDDLPEDVVVLAANVTRGTSTPYEQALALQDWFRESFEYELTNTPAGHDESAILTFLEARRGYCEQFAGTYAAMARTLGLPARVAVGFTPGDPSSDGRTYTVRGRNAHAWPEVWIPRVGWVAFEPTPGRGQPGAQDYTGVEPEQDEREGLPVPPTTAPTATTAPGPGPDVPPPTTVPPSERTPEQTASSPGGSTGPWRAIAIALGAAAALVALDAAVIALWRRARSRRHRLGHPVRGAWRDAVAALALAGTPPTPVETDAEFAARAAPDLGDDGDALRDLAARATEATWSPPEAEPATAGGVEADALASRISRRARRDLGWRRRLLAALDPRTLAVG